MSGVNKAKVGGMGKMLQVVRGAQQRGGAESRTASGLLRLCEFGCD